MSEEKITMVVEMNVTISQAIALEAMFKRWNALASAGSSCYVSFYVDGDGNFRPNCHVFADRLIPALTPELEELACIADDGTTITFDYDPIAWRLHKEVQR